MEAPAETLSKDSVELRRWQPADDEILARMVSESVEHLRPWMPWASAEYNLTDAREYLQRCEDGWSDGSAFQYLILDTGEPAGSAGLMARIGDGGLEIGYWVHPGHTGHGVATAATAALTEAAFALPGIDHVEIHHDQLNLASERIPVKLGYSCTGTMTARFDLAPGDSGVTKVWRITR
jgi:ribosomal-protein-serine acetyltransferase